MRYLCMLSPSQFTRALRAKDACGRLGLTQSTIANEFQVTQSHISRILSGKVQHANKLFEDVCLFIERFSDTTLPSAVEALSHQDSPVFGECNERSLGPTIIRPISLPDELDEGYAGYVMRLNGLSSMKELDGRLRAWSGCADKSGREISRVELLSNVAGLTVREFVLRHTTLPLRRGITSYQPNLPHGSDQNKDMWWTVAMRATRPGAFFCKKCIQEDLSFHGRSYWRRAHQVPGLLSCEKHASPLSFCKDQEAFHQPPSHWVDQCETVDEVWAEEVMGNETVVRYLAICDGLMTRGQPFAVDHVSLALRTRAASLGIQTYSGKVVAPLLSDKVIDCCGRRWLALLMPTLAEKQERVILNRLDGVLYMSKASSNVLAYVLACAVIYPSADEALNALARPLGVIRKGTRRQQTRIAQNELTSAYAAAKGSYVETAKLLDVTFAAVAKRLSKMGLPNMVEAKKKNTRKALSAYLEEGCPLDVSAERGGLSLGEFGDVLRVIGVGAIKMLDWSELLLGKSLKRSTPLTPDAV